MGAGALKGSERRVMERALDKGMVAPPPATPSSQEMDSDVILEEGHDISACTQAVHVKQAADFQKQQRWTEHRPWVGIELGPWRSQTLDCGFWAAVAEGT